MPYSSKSHSSSSHSQKSRSHRSHSSSSSSNHPSSHASSHDSYSIDHKHKRSSSHNKYAGISSNHDVEMSSFVDRKERAAREKSKKESKDRYRHGPSSSALDKDQRRKQQNRNSSQASDAGKKARLSALGDAYVIRSVEGERKDQELHYMREMNADLSDSMKRKNKY